MVPFKTGFLTLLLIASAPSFGSESTNESPKAEKNRSAETLKILEENIEKTERNFETASSNEKTVNQEISKTESLELEYQALRVQYEAYLGEAESALAKNKKSLEILKAYIETGTTPEGSPAITDSEKARLEEDNRKKWAGETSQKVARVKKLLQENATRITEITAKRASLLQQKDQWEKRIKQHKLLLTELQEKRDTVISQMETPAPTSPKAPN